MHGGIEEAAGCARGPRARARRPGTRSGLASIEPAVAIEPRELGVVAEARHHLLEPLELRLGRVERASARSLGSRVEEQLDVRAHRRERAAQYHDVLVIVSGGRLTTRTAGALRRRARALRDCACAAICACRARSATGRRPCGCRRPAARASRRREAAAHAGRARRAGDRACAVAHGRAATAAQLTKNTTTAIATA